jgi:DNA-binding MurR/RpiR family transcriptional regulator
MKNGVFLRSTVVLGLFLLLNLFGALPARAQGLEIIELKQRSADQVLPTLLPLVEPGGTLTGVNNQLFLRASPRNREEIKRVLDVINQAGRVQLVGIGGSALTAKDLWYKLLKIGVTTLFAQDSHVQISIAQTLGPGDVQLVVSYSGASRDVLAAAELATRNGATLIAVTSFRNTPLRQMADMVLDTVADENELRISSISSRTAQNTITDILFLGLVQRRDEAWALIDGTRGAIDRLNKE